MANDIIEIESPGPQGPPGPQGIPGPSGSGVPVGGTTGQALTKKSNADYDVDWELTSASQVAADLATHEADHANPHVVTAAQVGLPNVLNAAQLVAANNLSDVPNKPTALSNLGAQPVLGFTAENAANKTTDGTLAANSDTLYPSEKAVKTYADTKQPALGFTPENAANKNAVNGYPGLDGSGKINAAQLPAIAVNNTYVVTSQAQMLLLAANVGDVAIRTDVSETFILQATPPSSIGNWQQLLSPTSPVTSVAGKTGPVTLVPGDVGLGAVSNALQLIASNNLGDMPNKPTALSNLGAQAALGFTPENVSNKTTDGTLSANSDSLYPSEKAVKTYADTKQTALGFTPENASNKNASGGYPGLSGYAIQIKNAIGSIVSFFTNSNTVARTYTFQDRNGTIADDTDLAGKQNSLGFTPENVTNKSTDGTLAANSDTLYPSQKAVKTYADTKQAALGFTPENVANKSTDGTFSSNSDTLYPSQKAAKTYADTKQTALGFTPENVANKDASGGYVGLTLFKHNFKNVLGTFVSFFTNSNTAARTYTFQDRNGTIADDTDISGRQPLATDLTTIAGLSPANNDFLQRKSGAWTNRTIAQVKTDLALPDSSVEFYGTGFDGDVTVSSGVTTLQRDMYYNNLTVNGTGSINTNGFRIYVKVTLDISAAPLNAITNTGTNGVNAASNAGAAAPTAPVSGTVSDGQQGGAGGAGGAAAGTAAVAVGAPSPSNGGQAGSGGAGGAGSGGVGGVQRASVAPALVTPIYSFVRDLIRGVSLIIAGGGGPGGGGGGGDGTAGGGGGSGANGGGTIWISANTVNRSGSTAVNAISTSGGNGGNGFSAAAGNRGGGGGAGGGGGGNSILFYGTLTGTTATQAICADGGTGGNGGNGTGTGTGGNGGNGGYGGRVKIINLTLSTSTEATGSAGTSGNAAVGTTGGNGGAGNQTRLSL